MTVAELIEQLGAFPADQIVWVGKGMGELGELDENSGVIIMRPRRS